MQVEYAVDCDGKTVGYVTIEKQGLYLCLDCCCDLPADTPYYVQMTAGDRRIDMGLCVKRQNGIGFFARLPQKAVGAEPYTFIAHMQNADKNLPFFPVDAEKPFLKLESLPLARFAMRNGQAGVTILQG